MLTKVVFTALVVIGVYALFRVRKRIGPRNADKRSAGEDRFGRLVSYGFVASLVAISVAVYLFLQPSNNEVVTVRVVNGNSGDSATYRVRRPTIEGRRFITADGRIVVLGASDRLEILRND